MPPLQGLYEALEGLLKALSPDELALVLMHMASSAKTVEAARSFATDYRKAWEIGQAALLKALPEATKEKA